MKIRTEEQQNRALDQIFDHLDLIEAEDPPPPSGDLTGPVFEGIVMADSVRDKFIFSRPVIVNNTWIAFVNTGAGIYEAESLDGLTNWVLRPTEAPYGSIIYDNMQWRALYHKWHIWFPGYCTTYMKVSEDKITWYDSSVDRTQPCGEDRTWLKDGDLYRCYIRPLPPTPPANAIRTIGYMESYNYLRGWSQITEVLAPDQQDGNNEFYMMSVIKTAVGYFGLLTVYNKGNFGTTHLQIVYSAKGKDNWQRCNNRQAFIETTNKQMYGNWSIVGDTVYIYTIDCKRGHDEFVAGQHHYSSRYKIALSELIKYKPI